MTKRLLKSILLSFILLLFTQTTFAKTIKFVQITDIMFNGSQKSIDRLSQAIKSVNSMKNVDFVVFTGNNTNRVDEDNLKLFFKTTRKLDVPAYFLIGSKEVRKSQFLGKQNYINILQLYKNPLHPHKPNYTFKKGSIEFIAVDGIKEVIPGATPYYTAKTLAWLDKKLTKFSDKKVILLQHFPYMTSTYNAAETLPNSVEYKEIISKYNNIIAIVAGQRDENDEILDNGIYHITTPALSGSNPAFKIIEIEINKTEHSVYTQLILLNETN